MLRAIAASVLVSAAAAPLQAQMLDPEGPLVRTAARLHVVEFEITLWEQPETGVDHPFKMSMIVDGPWSIVDPTTLRLTVHAGSELVVVKDATALGRPDAAGALSMSTPLPQHPRWPMVVKVHADAVSYSSALDESIAGHIPWPAAWPAPAIPSLRSEPLIESDSPGIRAAVEATVGTDPRAWGSPLAVAKRLIQASCAQFNLDGQHLMHGPRKTIRGINVRGAKAALEAGGGSKADLTCLSVAVLRAAGIPARPVIAVATEAGSRDDSLVVRGEFFLPEAGWIPFDADELRRRGVGSRKITDTWRGLGDCPDMDDIVGLSWTFAPDQGKHAYEAWACWSWTRLAPLADFPLPVGTGRVRIGDKIVVTGQANLHSQLLVRRWSKGRIQEVPPSPWRVGP